MENAQVREAVMNIIADIALDEDVTQIKDDLALRDQLDLDSMDFLDIVMELKKDTKLKSQEDYPKLATMESCVNYLGQNFTSQ